MYSDGLDALGESNPPSGLRRVNRSSNTVGCPSSKSRSVTTGSTLPVVINPCAAGLAVSPEGPERSGGAAKRLDTASPAAFLASTAFAAFTRRPSCRGRPRRLPWRRANGRFDNMDTHQAASRRQKSSWFQEVDRDANDHADCRLQTALAVPSRVFWPRVHTGRVHTGRARTCSLNRRPRYALGREHAHVPVCTRGQNPPRSSRPLVRNAG